MAGPFANGVRWGSIMPESRFNPADPATAADRGWNPPVHDGSANLRAALTHGQELLLAPVTESGLTALTFPGVAVGELPTGGAAGWLRWKNTDVVPVRVRRIYLQVGEGPLAEQGAFLCRFRIGASYLHTGWIHSGTIFGTAVPFDLGEGFVVLPGDTLTMEAMAQVAVPFAFTSRVVMAAIRIVNFKREPVPNEEAKEAALLKRLHQAIESADSRTALAVIAEEDLKRRWWAFSNGQGIEGGVGADPSVYGFQAVDLTAGGPVVTGFMNQQTGPFLLEGIMLFQDGADPTTDGFQVSQVQIANTNFISEAGGPIRSDVVRWGRFPQAAQNAIVGSLVLPYVLGVPIWMVPNRPLRVTLDVAVGLTPGRVWMLYVGTLFGNPQK